jgi:sec-independent protein translocase protein TatA
MPVFAEILSWEFLLVLLLIALVFGASRIPKLARALGQASKEFRNGTTEDTTNPEDESPPSG